jgi:hypothetical protein
MAEPLSWRRIIAESVAVVASILLAFAIDAAWDHRQVLQEEQELLVGLEREFVESQFTLARSRELTTRTVEQLIRFLSMSADELAAIPSSASWYEVYFPIVITWQDPIGTGFLDATRSSGKLAMIRNAELRASLARFAVRLPLLQEPLTQASDVGAQAGAIAGELEGISTQVGRPDRAIGPATLRALRQDPRITGLAASRVTLLNVYLLRLGFLENAIAETLSLTRGQLKD